MSSKEQPLPRYPLSWRSWRFRSVLSLVLLVLAIRLIWGASASRRLQDQIAQIRQRGQPAVLADLKVEPLDDAHNAWLIQTKAENALSRGPSAYSPRSGNATYREYPPFPAGWMNAAAASEKANAQAFVLIRQMRGLNRSQFVKKWTSPAYTALLPSFNNTRNLANTVADGALYSHVHGDDYEAIERVRDLLQLGHSVRQEPSLVAQLVAMGIESLAYNDLLVIAPGLRLQAGEGIHPATRAQVQSLISQLLDDQFERQSFQNSLIMERVLAGDYIHWSADNNWFIYPCADLEVRRSNRLIEKLVEASAEPDWPSAEKFVQGFDPELTKETVIPKTMNGASQPGLPQYSRWFGSPEGGPPSTRNIETQFRISAERRMTAVSLAAQLYRTDHGRWPQRLEDLVRAYLPALPSDPFQPDKRPLGYRIIKGVLPDGGDRPLVFSETPGAKVEPLLNMPMYDFQPSIIPPRVRFIRQYRDLARFEPITSSKGVDHNPNKSGAPGN